VTRNQARRDALLDAAISVLAADGARGLTFRRIDEESGLPTGTTTNYFADRDELLRQLGERIFTRLQPDPDRMAGIMAAPPSPEQELALMHDLMARVAADRVGYLAFLELRLEATRRPELRASLAATVRADLDAGISFHVEAGLPGGRSTVQVLYLAMTGLILQALTVPEVLAPDSVESLTETIVRTIVPQQ
jgi:DNA-binding transcriptional regulator YbjK